MFLILEDMLFKIKSSVGDALASNLKYWSPYQLNVELFMQRAGGSVYRPTTRI